MFFTAIHPCPVFSEWQNCDWQNCDSPKVTKETCLGQNCCLRETQLAFFTQAQPETPTLACL